MPSPDRWAPERMSRVAVVATRDRWADTVDELAASGAVELDAVVEAGSGGAGAVHPATGDGATRQWVADAALASRRCRLLVGWAPSRDLAGLQRRLGARGGQLVVLPQPRHVIPPTRLPAAGVVRAFRPLVDTYGSVPYRDVDPTAFAGIAYALMFGMMFGDIGHGLLLVCAALGVRSAPWPPARRLRRAWLPLLWVGVSATAFGVLYGEAFGPTGLPALWLRPMDDPVRLLASGVAVGVVLMAVAFTLGSVNRWREAGRAAALVATSGIAGALVFTGVGVGAAGLAFGGTAPLVAGGVVAGAGLLLTAVGALASAGGGGTGAAQAVVEVVETVIRLLSNLASFARLAAFGLTHAAIGWVVWNGTAALWGGVAGGIAAVLLFTAGNALAFALGALVAGIQALRLEYYELFSRVLISEGRAFQPWCAAAPRQEEDR